MEVDQNIFKKISIHLIIRMKIRNCSFISRKSTKHKVKIGKQSSFLWGSYETFSHEYMIPFFCHYSYRMIAFCFCTSSNLHQVSLCGLSYQTTKSAKEKTVCLSFVSWLSHVLAEPTQWNHDREYIGIQTTNSNTSTTDMTNTHKNFKATPPFV